MKLIANLTLGRCRFMGLSWGRPGVEEFACPHLGGAIRRCRSWSAQPVSLPGRFSLQSAKRLLFVQQMAFSCPAFTIKDVSSPERGPVMLPGDITLLLQQADRGDRVAADALYRLVEKDLRAIAG